MTTYDRYVPPIRPVPKPQAKRKKRRKPRQSRWAVEMRQEPCHYFGEE